MNVSKLAGLALAGLLPLSVTPAMAAAHHEVEWSTCDRPDLPVIEGTECGRLTVPVDWSNPSGGTAELRVFRWKAANSGGTILNFPSGPGQTGDLSFGSLRRALPRGLRRVAGEPEDVLEVVHHRRSRPRRPPRRVHQRA